MEKKKSPYIVSISKNVQTKWFSLRPTRLKGEKMCKKGKIVRRGSLFGGVKQKIQGFGVG